MNTEQDYIDKLYSEKFENFEFQNSDEEWNKLNVRLGRSNFLKFSIATFNIYFLIIILSFAGTATFLGVEKIIQTREIKKLENEIEILHNQENGNGENLIMVDSSDIENKQMNQKTNNISNSLSVSKKNRAAQNETDNEEINIKDIPKLSRTKDSVLVKQDTSSLIKPETPKIKRVKKTIFIKRDKVLVNDTVILKNKVK